MFPDFLNMFRAELLDLQAILMYLSMDTSLESPPREPTLIEVGRLLSDGFVHV
jgi:hypothetical protein